MAQRGEEGVDGMSQEQIQEYKEAFGMFDKDGNGQISRNELGSVLRSLGRHLTQMELTVILRDLDEDGDNMLNFTEFINIID